MSFVIPELIQENIMLFGVVFILSLLGVSIKIVSLLINFYEEVLITRYFKRIASLAGQVSESSKIGEYLMQLKENEIFRLASGIKVSPEKSQMLIDIYLYGLADNRELKRIQRFMKPLNGKIYIETDWSDKLQILYSICAALYLMVTGIVLGGPHVIYGEGSEIFAGFLTMTVLIVTAAIVGNDYRTYRTLKRIRDRLQEQGRVENPQANLMWHIPWKKY